MYQWDRQKTSLQTTPNRILRIERSIADVQVSLPGLSPEAARAYVCAYHEQGGIRVAVVLHLLQSDRLAFYLNDGGPLDSEDAGRALAEGLHFAETMGFSLSDLDFRRRPKEEQQQLWKSMLFFLAADPARPGRPKEEKPAPEPPPVAGQPRPAEGGATVEPPPADPAERRIPSDEEMLRRRRAFIQNLGRLLAML